MFWHQIEITFFTVAIIAGCASAPSDIESDIELENDVNKVVNVDHTVDDGPVTFKDYLDSTDPNSVRRCRKEAHTGSRIKRTVCGPQKDDIDLLRVIGGTSGPVSD